MKQAGQVEKKSGKPAGFPYVYSEFYVQATAICEVT